MQTLPDTPVRSWRKFPHYSSRNFEERAGPSVLPPRLNLHAVDIRPTIRSGWRDAVTEHWQYEDGLAGPRCGIRGYSQGHSSHEAK